MACAGCSGDGSSALARAEGESCSSGGCSSGMQQGPMFRRARGLEPYEVASELRSAIHQETGLTCSAGVAPNRMIAKIRIGYIASRTSCSHGGTK